MSKMFRKGNATTMMGSTELGNEWETTECMLPQYGKKAQELLCLLNQRSKGPQIKRRMGSQGRHNRDQSESGIVISQEAQSVLKTILKEYLSNESRAQRKVEKYEKALERQKKGIQVYERSLQEMKAELEEAKQLISKFQTKENMLLKRYQHQINRVLRNKVLLEISNSQPGLSQDPPSNLGLKIKPYERSEELNFVIPNLPNDKPNLLRNTLSIPSIKKSAKTRSACFEKCKRKPKGALEEELKALIAQKETLKTDLVRCTQAYEKAISEISKQIALKNEFT